jgi:hypothetical protein
MTQDHEGRAQPLGETHRVYVINHANKNCRVTMPAGVLTARVEQPAIAVLVQPTAAPAGVLDATKALPLAANGTTYPARPILAGEFLKIRSADDSANVGVCYVVLEGKNLPDSLAVATPS